MKPGYLTTEFWIAAASQILALMVILGVVSSQDKATLEGAVSNAITAVGTIAASAVVIWKYIQSRTAIKAGETVTALNNLVMALKAQNQGAPPPAS